MHFRKTMTSTMEMAASCCGNSASGPEHAELLIVGVGNLLCGDDGLGAMAVQELQRRYRLPRGVTAADGGTLGLALLPFISEANRVIVMDAVLSDGRPGSLVRFSGEQIGAQRCGRFSGHQLGIADLVAALRLSEHLPELVLVGLVPRMTHAGIGLSPEVQQALPELLAAVVAEAHRFGFTLLPT